MEQYSAEDIYETLLGLRIPEYSVPEVEDAFAPDSPCAVQYARMLDAYAHLREKLGAEEYDADVEAIINSLLDIQRLLCLKMYSYGLKDKK